MGEIKKRNLLIKNSETNIEKFKKSGVDFFNSYDKIYLFNFRNYLINTLLNMEVEYLSRYNTILVPNENYLLFYRKKGTSIYSKNAEIKKANINFSLEKEYYDLYYNLMHTFYINEKNQQSNYSVSIFFDEIVNYITNYKSKLLI